MYAESDRLRPTWCARLLEDCALLELLEHPRAPARERLENALGPDLAQKLLRTLALDDGVRSEAAA